MVSPSDWERTRATFASAPARPPTTRTGTSVATARTKVNPAPEQSMFGQLGAVATTAYNAIPQPVKTLASNAFSGETFLNTLSGNDQLGTFIRSGLKSVPYAGGLLGTAFDIGAAPATWLTAGFGGAASAGLRTLGTAGKVAATLVAPISSGGFQSRLFSEIVAGTGASFAAEKAAENDWPLPAQIAAGAIGGATALGLKGMVTGALTPRQGPAIAAAKLATNLHGRTFLNSPRAFDDLVAEIKPPSNALEESAVGRAVNSLANPSKNLDPNDIGVLALAHRNQRTTGHQLADVGVSAALDVFDKGTLPAVGRAGAIFDIDESGLVRNIAAPKGKSAQILDVLSDKHAPRTYKFTADQKSYFDAYHSFVAEVRDLAEQYGVTMPKKTLDEDTLYVMRVALGTEEVDFKRLSNPFMKRLYEDAQDAVAAGVRYENDPRTLALIQAQSVYNHVADAQFEAAMAPRLVTAKQALIKTNPHVVAEVTRTAKQYGEALKAGRQERDVVMRELASVNDDKMRLLRQQIAAARRGGDETGIEAAMAELKNFEQSLPNVRTRRGAPVTTAGQMRAGEAKDAFMRAKNLYKQELERVSKSEALPEYVFGASDSAKSIRVGQWKGKFLPETDDYLKLAKEMNMMTGRPNPVTLNPLAKGLEQTGNLVRYASANADFGMPFIQGLHLLGQDPRAWTKMTVAHYKAALDPSYGARYIRNNLADAQALAALGVPIGDVEQYVASAGRRGRNIANTAIGRQTMKRFEGAYATGSSAARIEAYKALKPHWDGTADELATYIRNLTGAQSSAALGVSPNMRALESTWLAFSPRMFRSTLALVMHAADPSSAVGRQAARSLLGLAGVATTMAVSTRIGLGLAQGESAEDIQRGVEEMLDPTAGRKFLSIPIGDQYIGVGGQVRSITQFVAKAMVNPAGFATADALENPLINFYMGRGAVGVNIVGSAVEGLSGGSVDVLPFSTIDNPVDAMLHIGKSVFPFAVQAQYEAEGLSAFDRTTLLLSSTAGLNSSPKTASNRIDELAQQQHGKPYFELTGKEQQALEDARPDLFELRAKDKSEFGNAAERTRIRAIQQVDTDRVNHERALVDALNRNAMTVDQFRQAMKDVQAKASTQKRTLYGEDSFKGVSDANKEAVSGWYATYDAAKIDGTDVVDWQLHDQIEAQYLATLTPEQRRYVDERRVTRHAPEAQPYFDREETIRESGYYDSAESAFERFRASAPPGVLTYTDLALAVQRATLTGDRLSLVRLKRFQSRIDSVADQVKTRMRRANPELDAALVLNGRVSKPASRATDLGG